MQMVIIESVKLVIALAILACIAKFREPKPLGDPFFAEQKWTLADAYKILLPITIAVFLLFILSRLVPTRSFDTILILQIITYVLYCTAIYILFWLNIKTPHSVTMNTFGLERDKFLQAAVLPTNIVTILFLACILFERKPSQMSAAGYTDMQTALILLLLGIGVLIIPPLEELLYRGILFPPVIRRIPKWQAIVCLSLVESLSHVQAKAEMIGLFLLFLFLYFLYGRSKSLYSPIIFHIGQNFITSRPQMKALLAAHIDGKILDQCFIWGILLFAFCINLSWFMRRKRNTGQESTRSA